MTHLYGGNDFRSSLDWESDLSHIFTFVEYKLLRIRTFVFGVKMKFGPRKKGVGSSQTLLATCTVLHRNQWEIFHDG